jgi:hypothetical protein
MHAAAPMWRNGRRNGLKIRWAVIGPCRFESGHRHRLKSRFSQGRFVKIYLATIRQVIPLQNRFKNFGLGLLIRWSYVPDSGADNETYFTSANSGTLHKKCSILSRARVHAMDQASDSSCRRRTRSSLWRCR